MIMTRRGKIMVNTIGVVLGVLSLTLFWFYRTQTVWVESPAYERQSIEPTRTLVVVYSRTGNTLGAAKEVAKIFDAELLEIGAPMYTRDLKGQNLAAKHADAEVTTTPIEHDPVDLSKYETVILCSPTWWYRPAIPLWSFVENHDLTGNRVLLLMTGNSRLTEERTGKFGDLVRDRGGEFIDAIFIQRGRVYWQKSTGEVNAETRDAVLPFKESFESQATEDDQEKK